ncbi:hypothetical protein PINS_up016450 [Pythium insidiosum]|nr:hypothetical protein PINS_up016450 [Pythium insidiosum]
MKAGIEFRAGGADLEEHIQQFVETLHDKTLQMQFRFTPVDSIDDLENKLIQYETAQIRPAKKPQVRRQMEDFSDPAVNKIDGTSGVEDAKPVRPVVAQPAQAQGSTKQTCEECGKSGHSKSSCFKLMVCEHCGRQGHSIGVCRSFIEEMVALHAKTKAAEASSSSSSN